MKKKIITLLFLIITILVSCKSKEITIDKDTVDSTVNTTTNIKINGIISKYNEFDINSNEYEVRSFVPVYFKLNGKDTVILKEKIVIKREIAENKIENISIDTTTKKQIREEVSLSTDQTQTDKEIKTTNFGFLILCIIGGLIILILLIRRFFRIGI